MTKFIKYATLLLLSLTMLSACKKDEEGKNIVSDSVRISAFSLKSDSTVLENLNNVFFTIDLEKGLIYNADSLPKGTQITKLRFNITTDSASEVNITNVDTTYNYLNDQQHVCARLY